METLSTGTGEPYRKFIVKIEFGLVVDTTKLKTINRVMWRKVLPDKTMRFRIFRIRRNGGHVFHLPRLSWAAADASYRLIDKKKAPILPAGQGRFRAAYRPC